MLISSGGNHARKNPRLHRQPLHRRLRRVALLRAEGVGLVWLHRPGGHGAGAGRARHQRVLFPEPGAHRHRQRADRIRVARALPAGRDAQPIQHTVGGAVRHADPLSAGLDEPRAAIRHACRVPRHLRLLPGGIGACSIQKPGDRMNIFHYFITFK
jgi:hypothetical protein